MSAYYASKLVQIALAEVGYLEKASNSNLQNKTANAGHNNYDKYAQDLADVKWFNGNKNGYDWCTCFASWCYFKLANGNVKDGKNLCYQPQDSNMNYAAGCGYAVKYYKNNNAWTSNSPQPGYQIFFDWSYRKGEYGVDHTGIVQKVENGRVYTVEGNTYSGGKEGVFEHSYALGDGCIVGYGIPKFDKETKTPEPAKKPEPAPEVKPTTPVAKPDIVYAIRVDGKWSKEYKNGTIAGVDGQKVTDIMIKLSDKSAIKYRAHISGGAWLPWVTGYNKKDDENGYAGDNKPIDAIEIKCSKYDIRYKTSGIKNGTTFYAEVKDATTSGSESYAGAFGNVIDKVSIKVK